MRWAESAKGIPRALPDEFDYNWGMIARNLLASAWLALSLIAVAAAEPPRADMYFKIAVVDRQTGRGVPLAELRTVHGVRYVTDSNGVIAFFEPGLMGEDVFFFVSSHGYEFPKDGFGIRGKALKALAGGSARLEIDRINIAERLYRITGADIYADSLLVGEPTTKCDQFLEHLIELLFIGHGENFLVGNLAVMQLDPAIG